MTFGHWEAITDDDGQMTRVRWSVTDREGRYLWVRHYPGEWGRNAAERQAEEFNKENRRPWEWDGFEPIEEDMTDPIATDTSRDKKLAAHIETLLGIELLEYHDQNLLALDSKQRNEEKRAILNEALLLTGERTERSRTA